VSLFHVAFASVLGTAQENKTANEAFRVGPTVIFHPLDSKINKSQDGTVELFLNNPSLVIVHWKLIWK